MGEGRSGGRDIKALIKRVVVFLFAAALINGLVVLSFGWGNSVLDQHGFRQAQTAISSLFMLRGGPWLAYETPLLGPVWTIPLEFPLYQWFVVGCVRLTGMGLDQAGRAVSISFFLISLGLVYACLGHWRMPRSQRLVFLTLILVSPLYLFWSRTFMIESLALCLSLAYVLFSSRFIRNSNLGDLAMACVFGSLASLTKVTTFFAFSLAVALLLAGIVFARDGRKLTERLRAGVGVASGVLVGGALVPLGFALMWTRYADSLKEQVPFAANFITSSNLIFWNFGNYEQRVSSLLWDEITLQRIIPDTFGSVVVPLVLVLLVVSSGLWLKKYRLAMVAGGVLFLAAQLTFTNLHIVHNYYQYANAIFLIAAAGFGIASLMDSDRAPLMAQGLAVFIFFIVSGVSGYHERFRDLARHNTEPHPIADIIRAHIPENGVIWIYGADWSSEIPYYAGRRAIMDKLFRPIEHAEVQQTLDLLGDRRIDGVVSCTMHWTDPEGLNERLSKLGFEIAPVESSAECQLHLPTIQGDPPPVDSISNLSGSDQELLAQYRPEDR